MGCTGLCNDGTMNLNWQALPPLPAPGVAGPFAGLYGGALLVAGGANFPCLADETVWNVPKVWHDEVYLLPLSDGTEPAWQTGFRLNRPVACGATVTTRHGVICMGGEDSQSVFKECFLLRWTGEKLMQIPLPDLPQLCSYSSATVIGDTVYLAGGQSGRGLGSALHNFWALDLSRLETSEDELRWIELPPWPGPQRTLNLTLAQHNGSETCVYVISGRSGEQGDPGCDVLRDVYEFNPRTVQWRRRSDIPEAVYAGAGAAIGSNCLAVLSGVDLATVLLPPDLREQHPGFPRRVWNYNTETDLWTEAGESPENQIVTPAFQRGEEIFLASGEIAPRRRSRSVWRITLKKNEIK